MKQKIIWIFLKMNEKFGQLTGFLERMLGLNPLKNHDQKNIMIPHYGHISFVPYTARPHYIFVEKKSFGFRRAAIMDPLNLIFLNATSEKVQEVLERAGWTAGSGGSQHILFEGKTYFPSVQMELESERSPDSRYHVRMYAVKKGRISYVLAGAHHEFYDEHEENHMIYKDGWESAKRMVHVAFKGYFREESPLIYEENYHGRESNGRATVIDM